MKPLGNLVRGELARLLRLAIASPERAREYARGLLAELGLDPEAGVTEILERLRADELDVAAVVAAAWEIRTGEELEVDEYRRIRHELTVVP